MSEGQFIRITSLSPIIYHLRNRGRSLVDLLATVISTVGVIIVATLADSVMATYLDRHRYLQSVISVVSVDREANLPPDTTAALLERSPLVRVAYPQITLEMEGTMIAGNTFFDCLFVSEEHAWDLLDLYQLRIEEGRLPHRNTEEIAMSEELAKNRSLQVGDEFGRSLVVETSEEKTFTLVGILRGDTQLALGSYGFARRTLLPAGFGGGVLVVPTEPAQEDALRDFLSRSLRSDQVEITSYRDVVQTVREGETMMQWIMGVIVTILTVVTASTAGLISVLHFNQRLAEFGILAALGYGKGRLAARIISETVTLVVVSWGLGVFVAHLVLSAFSSLILAPQGLDTGAIGVLALLYSAITPIAMTALSVTPVVLNLLRLDPVSIIDRRI